MYDPVFLGSKITADDDYSHDIKWCLLLGRKAMTNIDSILKSRDITLPTHVHRVSDAIQPSHPLSFPSPPTLNPSQHQSLFQWANSSHEVAKVLEFQLQHQTFQWIFPLGWTGWFSLQSKRLSRIFSNTTVQKHQFFSILHSPTLTSIHDHRKNNSFD